jgi:hypothetical protein
MMPAATSDCAGVEGFCLQADGAMKRCITQSSPWRAEVDTVRSQFGQQLPVATDCNGVGYQKPGSRPGCRPGTRKLATSWHS